MGAKGLLYERQQNYYRSLGHSPDEVVTISSLGQAIMSILLSEPDNARARPSTLLDKDDEYNRVFDESVDLETYVSLVRIMRRLDSYISDVRTPARYRVRNFRFHVAWLAVMSHFRSKIIPPQAVGAMRLRDVNGLDLAGSWRRLERYARDFNADRGWAEDKIAKSPEFTQYVLATVRPSAWT